MKKLANSKRGGGLTKKNLLLKRTNYCFKILISSILAFLILNIICSFYFNIPYSDKNYENSSLIITPFKYEPMENFTYALEGYGHGRVNNDGYVNIDDYDSNKEINILMLGSSQFEAFQVDIKNSVTYKLNEKLKNKFVYNLGISGNAFPNTITNLTPAIKKYKPTDYIVLETSNIEYSDKELIKVLNDNNIKTNSENSDNLQFVKNNSFIKNFYKNSLFLRLVRRQLEELTGKETDIIENEEIGNFNETLTRELLNKIRNIIGNEVKVIIVYHPYVTIDSDGNLNFLDNKKENIEKFDRLCQENGIYFLNMSDKYREEYNKNYILPYGFNNTSVGKGHLNKYGHEMIADELYKLIEGVE